MAETKITSVTVEVTHADTSACVVVRQPGSDAQRVYVAGELPPEVADDVLRALGLAEAAAPSSVVGAGAPSSRRSSAPLTFGSSELMSAPSSSPDALADLLEELATAVLRAGHRQPTTTVDELLQRAWRLAEDKTPVARALASLEEGLERDAPAIQSALALAALGELVSALRGESGDLRGELQGRRDSIESCTVVEVGRRRERGALCWETRLLLDLGSGHLFREEGAIGDRRLSRGIVGRLLSVSLGRRRGGLAPPRIEVQQYEYEPTASAAQLDAAGALASPHLPELSASGLELLLVPRPVWLTADAVDVADGTAWLATGATTLPLGDGSLPGAIATLLEAQGGGSEIRAVGGSLELRPSSGAGSGEESHLVLVPWSALVEEGAHLRLLDLST
ncbi:MAG: hypothetical protein GX607_09270 [Myxococcales bacterium]|jgi:hypothetical protein|nr:hypothetical protein [Myxococcales bacterium]